jgi:SAM-dependent methyltransferase
MSRRKPIALEAYETLAARYASQVDRKAENAYYERPATLSLLPPVAGKRVLDAGCGPGVYAEWLREHGAEVVGVDASPKMIGFARRRLGKGVALHIADLEQPIDFLEAESFDIVLCTLALDYLKDWDRVFAQFNRALRSFGVLVFSAGHPFMDYRSHTETSYYVTSPVKDIWTGFGIKVAVPYYRRPLSSMLTPLIDAGFTIERVLEPQPDETLKTASPRAYEALSELPGFLCVRARKATASRPVKNGHLRR